MFSSRYKFINLDRANVVHRWGVLRTLPVEIKILRQLPLVTKISIPQPRFALSSSVVLDKQIRFSCDIKDIQLLIQH